MADFEGDGDLTEAPELADVIETVVDARLVEMNTVLPGKINRIDGNMVEVQIQLKRTYEDGQVVEVSPLINVPISQSASNGGRAGLFLPVKKGDTGTLLFCQRSLNRWLEEGVSVDPQDDRRFDLSDAIFIPGLAPFSKTDDFETKNAVLKNSNMNIVLHPGGQIEIRGATEDFVGLMSELIDVFIDTTPLVDPNTGIMNPSATAILNLLKTRLGTLIP